MVFGERTGHVASGGWVVAIAVLAMAAERPAAAADVAPTERSNGYLSLQIENDLFDNGADRHYTHGTGLSYFSEPCRHQWVERTARAIGFLPGRGGSCERNRVGFSLGQAIFTPADLSRTPPDPLDRPYAGWLALAAGLVAEDAREGGALATGRYVDRGLRKMEISLGVVGPSAGAGAVQRTYHQWIGAARPEGWEYQLRNEPALLISYEYLRRFGYRVAPGLEVDATPHLGVSLGNVYTQGALGLTLRIGRDMLLDYGPPRLRPSLPGAAFFERPDTGIGWYIFGGIEARAVARNIFLDGNSFREGPHVDKRHFVGDAQVGVAVTLGRVRLSFTNVYRSREFSGQPERDEFGSVSISVQL